MERLIKDKKSLLLLVFFFKMALIRSHLRPQKKKCMIDLHRKRFLDDRTQSIDGLAHIRSATDDIDRINT